VNYLLGPAEMQTIVQHSGMRALLTDEPFTEQAQKLARLSSRPLEVIEVTQVLASPRARPSGIGDRPAEAPAIILYTSGTTGDPKGVMLSHRNILSNCEAYSQVFDFDDRDHFVCVLPLFHTFAITTNLLATAYTGSTLHLLPRFQPRQVYELLQAVPCGIFVAVPSMFNVMAKLPGEDHLERVRITVSGGAAMPREVQKAFEERFGSELLEGYGLTEASPVVCSNAPGRNRPGTIGRPLPGIEVQVWDSEDRVVSTGQRGELMVRGPNVMLGYYKNREATADAVTPDGWLRTGDMATLDEDGWVRIVGRKKELIVSAGENIYPREIEDVLLTHPKVFEAAVVSMEDALRGEVPRAVVAPIEGKHLDPQELREFCRHRLAEFKVPRVYEIVPALPKTPTGKIMKKVL
jgi:long-chain acyl-CoA synthetase